jgi:RNA polymerase sigma-70 factor (ECF subfamily)
MRWITMNSAPNHAQQDREASGAITPEALFHRYARAVFAVCLANTRNYHDAEDVMQSVFLKATTTISTLRDPEQAKAWLLQVARRKCIDFHRRERQTVPLLEEPSSPSVGVPAIDDRLHAAIQKLPQEYRETLVLYYLDGQSCATVAASLSSTETAIRQRLVRARAMLHNLLQEEEL